MTAKKDMPLARREGVGLRWTLIQLSIPTTLLGIRDPNVVDRKALEAAVNALSDTRKPRRRATRTK